MNDEEARMIVIGRTNPINNQSSHMDQFKSNDFTYYFSFYLLSFTIPALISPKFVIGNLNDIVIGKILTFLKPFPKPNDENESVYRVLFSAATAVGILYNHNAYSDHFVKGTLKSLGFFSTVAPILIATGRIR